MNQTPLLSFWASSQDPTQVSTTVDGVIVGASSIIIAAASVFFHITLTANSVITLGTDLGIVAGAVAVVLGLAHKLIQRFGKITPPVAN